MRPGLCAFHLRICCIAIKTSYNIKFTHSFKAYHSVDFSVLTGLYSHHHGQFGNIFITLKRNPIPASSHVPFSLQPHPQP